MKLLVLFVDNFEDTEAVATCDVLARGGIEVVKANLMDKECVSSKYGFEINNIKPYLNDNYDGVVIPGGPGSFQIMPQIKLVSELITKFMNEKKLVAAICAAPHLVGKLGYLNGKPFTCSPGFENQVIGGIYQRENGVVRTDNIITAKSMYYSIEFGLEIVKYFYGSSYTKKLRNALMGEK